MFVAHREYATRSEIDRAQTDAVAVIMFGVASGLTAVMAVMSGAIHESAVAMLALSAAAAAFVLCAIVVSRDISRLQGRLTKKFTKQVRWFAFASAVPYTALIAFSLHHIVSPVH